jgi:hypothetical protein
MIKVTELREDLEPAYARWLCEHRESLIYASSEYRQFLARIVPGTSCCLLAFQDDHAGRATDSIAGALPYFRAEHPTYGIVINSLPWYGSHGGCILTPSAGPEVRVALLARYREMILHPDVLSAVMILTPGETRHLDQYVQALKPRLTDQRVGQMTALPRAGDNLPGRLERLISQKTRNQVRKSLKQGFRCETSDAEPAWRFLVETHRENLAAIGGRAKTWEQFMTLRKCLPESWRRLWIAKKDDRPVAALLLLYFNGTVEYFTPVIDKEFRSHQPLSFLIWHAMLDAATRGYQQWNWGGTWASQHSLHHFKAGWGASDRPYTYLINTTEQALEKLVTNQADIQYAFPFYYTHPYRSSARTS